MHRYIKYVNNTLYIILSISRSIIFTAMRYSNIYFLMTNLKKLLIVWNIEIGKNTRNKAD